MKKQNWSIHKFGGSSVADSDCFRRVARLTPGSGRIPCLSNFSGENRVDRRGNLRGRPHQVARHLRGLQVIPVNGAMGNSFTNYEGKATAALEALRGLDFVYLI